MAGYKRKRTIYRLHFEDPEMEGLEVDMTGASVDEFLAITEMSDLSEFAVDGVEVTAENLAQVKGAVAKLNDLFEAFARHLVAWNLEDDDDTPVPATFEGVKAQDPGFILDVLAAWLDAVGGVSGPKGRRSNGGVPHLEASLPMETLPPSPLTLSAPSGSSDVVSGSGASQAS